MINCLKYKTWVVSVCFFANGIFSAGAQKKIKPISVGELVPDISFRLVNSDQQSILLSDLRGKLVILDFWATWCGGCLTAFPKMESLQQKFGEKIEVILVNSINSRDSEERINSFFKKWRLRTGKSFGLASAIKDSLAYRYFPNKSLPHYVWIDGEGSVAAITGSDDVNEKNISKALKKDSLSLVIKKDFFGESPLYLGEDITLSAMMQYSLFLKGKIEGLQALSRPRIMKIGDKNVLRGWAMRNCMLYDMYKKAAALANPEMKNFEKRLVAEDSWFRDTSTLYSCDIVVSEKIADSAAFRLLDLLNDNSGYFGRWENRNIKCFAVVVNGSTETLRSKGGKRGVHIEGGEKSYVSNMSMDRLVEGLDRLSCIKIPVINETNYKEMIDADFKAEDLGDFESLTKALRKHGLSLVEKELEIEMFILSNNQKPVKQ